jgi:LCP family protein required for cell wall assembly
VSRHHHSDNNRWHPDGRVIVGIVALVLICCVGLFFLVSQSLGSTGVSRSGTSQAPSSKREKLKSKITVDGVTYQRNTSLKTILLLGVDQSEADRTYAVSGGGRSDAIALLIMNPDTNEMQVLEISRDSMVDVDVYNARDEYLYTQQMQLTLQYSVGSSASRSNWLMKNKVSDILYGMPVDYTMSLTMDGIAPVVEALGGITLTFSKDYTDIDPLFTKGTTMLLNGDQAYAFIHNRDITVTGSNDDRMERHLQVIEAMAERLTSMSTADIDTMMNTADPYMETDLDIDTVYALRSYHISDEILKAPGATQEGENHDEYYLDETALRQMVIDLFYQPK